MANILTAQQRLELCFELLRQHRRYQTAFDTPRNEAKGKTLIEARISAIRSELMPSLWGAKKGAAMLVPSTMAGAVQDALNEFAKGSEGEKINAGLLASDLIRMARMVESKEVDAGVAAVVNGKRWEQAANTIDSYFSYDDPSPATTPDDMKGYTFIEPVVQEWVDAGKPSESLREAVQATQFKRMTREDLADSDILKRTEQLEKDYETFNAQLIAQEQEALDAELSDQREGAYAQLTSSPEYKALEAKVLALYKGKEELKAKIRAILSQGHNVYEGSKPYQAAQKAIDEIAQISPVAMQQATVWSENQVITQNAKKRLRKNGYPPEQVIKDMAEFYRFVGGRVEKLVIDSKGDSRAYTINVGDHGTAGVIYIDSDFDKRVLWHEMGHHIESDPTARQAAQLFIRMRATNFEPKPLRNLMNSKKLKPEEIAFEDHYFSPYMGKIYAHGVTEIFSMVLESFSSPDLLATRSKIDPKSFEFVTGFLRSPQSTLQALHLAMRQSLRQINEQSDQAARKVGKNLLPKLLKRVQFVADPSSQWAIDIGHGDIYGKARFAGYVQHQGQKIYISKATIDTDTDRKSEGYGLFFPVPSKMPQAQSDNRKMFDIQVQSYETKDLDLIKVLAMLWLENGKKAWIKEVLEGEYV